MLFRILSYVFGGSAATDGGLLSEPLTKEIPFVEEDEYIFVGEGNAKCQKQDQEQSARKGPAHAHAPKSKKAPLPKNIGCSQNIQSCYCRIHGTACKGSKHRMHG
jgi:hypothetical protein